MQSTTLGAMRHRMADDLTTVADLLRRAFQLIEKVSEAQLLNPAIDNLKIRIHRVWFGAGDGRQLIGLGLQSCRLTGIAMGGTTTSSAAWASNGGQDSFSHVVNLFYMAALLAWMSGLRHPDCRPQTGASTD